jgi:hypothetical protein
MACLPLNDALTHREAGTEQRLPLQPNRLRTSGAEIISARKCRECEVAPRPATDTEADKAPTFITSRQIRDRLKRVAFPESSPHACESANPTENGGPQSGRAAPGRKGQRFLQPETLKSGRENADANAVRQKDDESAPKNTELNLVTREQRQFGRDGDEGMVSARGKLLQLKRSPRQCTDEPEQGQIARENRNKSRIRDPFVLDSEFDDDET